MSFPNELILKDQVPCQMRDNLGICEVCLLISLIVNLLKKNGNQYKKYRAILGYSYFIRKVAFYLERRRESRG